MMTQTHTSRPLPTVRPRRTVAVVSSQPHQRMLGTVLEAVDHDVVLVESAHAYSQIKRVTPDLVIVCLSSDDLDACQILSMLTLDSATSRIPVLTYMTSPDDRCADASDSSEIVFPQFVPVSVN